MSISKNIEVFEAFSVLITGFSLSEIQGTGLSETYYNVLVKEIGDKYLHELLNTFKKLDLKNCNDLSEMESICADEFIQSDYNEAIQTIILLWYTGQWNGQESYIVSSASYIEGLVWSAIDAHPMGAKQPGFGTWSLPPQTSNYSNHSNHSKK